MGFRRAYLALLRFAYFHFYNRFAFTYDAVSAFVSRGEWRKWTRAAIPFVRGTRVLEIACGTGNLQLDLYQAGYAACGVDLSPYMLDLARSKLLHRGVVPRLARARAQELPFSDGAFTTLILTFPPAFVADPQAWLEMRRVLAADGVLVWVDAAYLYPRNRMARVLNSAFRVAGGGAFGRDGDANKSDTARLIPGAVAESGWAWRVEQMEFPGSRVHVILGS